MPAKAPIILVTRPSAQASAFRAMLPGDADVLISPVLEIQPVEFSVDPDRYSAFVFGSGNGVRAAARQFDLSGRKAFVAGDQSGRIAAGLGMKVVSASGGSVELIAAVIKDKPGGKLLLVRGRHSTGDVAKTLILQGLDTDSVVAYDQVPVPLTAEARAVVQGNRQVILPLFSPRSASLLSAELTGLSASAPLVLVAMSAEILVGWEGPEPDRKIVTSQRTAIAVAQEIMGRIVQRS